MIINFTKMTALGNDYIFYNALQNDNDVDRIIPYIPKLSDRNFGIGGDGVIFLMSSDKADCRMRMFNSNGSEGAMCGNGIRELAKLVWDQDIIKKTPLSVETGNGILSLEMDIDNNNCVTGITVQMGELTFNATEIPFISPNDQTIDGIPIFTYPTKDKEFIFYVGGVGSKHTTCFIKEDIYTFDFHSIGKHIEQNKVMFPDGVNVEFVSIVSDKKCIMRVWERGAGHTLACGTGATFVVGLGMKLGLLDKNALVEVELEGGTLFISQKDNQMYMKGDAQIVFEGQINLSTL